MIRQILYIRKLSYNFYTVFYFIYFEILKFETLILQIANIAVFDAYSMQTNQIPFLNVLQYSAIFF